VSDLQVAVIEQLKITLLCVCQQGRANGMCAVLYGACRYTCPTCGRVYTTRFSLTMEAQAVTILDPPPLEVGRA
jgi:hypothetical protein